MTFWTLPVWGEVSFQKSRLRPCCLALQTAAEKSPGAYFLPEFALSPQGSFLEDTTGEQFLTYRYDDQVRSLETLALASPCASGQDVASQEHLLNDSFPPGSVST